MTICKMGSWVPYNAYDTSVTICCCKFVCLFAMFGELLLKL